MGTRKTGTGVVSQIRRILESTGTISKFEIKAIIFLTLSEAEIYRYQGKPSRKTKNKATLINRILHCYITNICYSKAWSKALGIKKTSEGGLTCENWTPPTTSSIETIGVPV